MSYRPVLSRAGLGLTIPIPVVKQALDNQPYPNQVMAAVHRVVSTKDVFDHMSFKARAAALTFSTVFNDIATDEEKGAASSFLSIAPDIARSAIVLGKAIFGDLEMSSNELVKTAQEIAGDVASVVPVVGALVNIFMDIAGVVGMASGIGPASSSAEERAAWCRRQATRVRGTGPNNAMMPCDIFVSGINGAGEEGPPSVGLSLINLLESTDIKDGIPPETRSVLTMLRKAIAASYKRDDGGVALWPLYLDIALRQFDAGRLPPSVIEAKNTRFADWLHADVKQPGETCYSYDRSGWMAAASLLDGWRKVAFSPYEQYKTTVLTDDQLIKNARAAMSLRLIMSHPSLSLNFKNVPAKQKPNLLLTAARLSFPPKKSSSTVGLVVAGGAAAAIVALAFL